MDFKKICIYITTIFHLNMVYSFQEHMDKIKRQENIKHVVKFISTCFNNNDGNIVIANDWNERDLIILKQVYTLSFPLVLIGWLNNELITHKYIRQVYRMNETAEVERKYSCKYFVLMVSSDFALKSMLETLKYSIWWNSQAIFLIVHKNLRNGCLRSMSHLNVTWTYNILSVIFLCENSEKLIELYTFNPYSRSAPKFWKVINNAEVHRDNWTLLQHPIESLSNLDNSSFCENLMFDRAKFLDGHHVKIGLSARYDHLLPYNAKWNKSKFFVGGMEGAILDTVWSYLRVKQDRRFYNSIGFLDDRGKPRPMLNDLNKDIIDCVSSTFQRDFLKYQSYPYDSSTFCIVSLKRPVTLIQKFLIVFTPKIWLILSTVYLISVPMLMYLLKQSMSTSALELLRMLMSTSSMRQPNCSSSRIFFISFVFLTLITNSYLQSQLNSMVVVQNSAPIIESISDLKRVNVTLYGPISLTDFWSLTKMTGFEKQYRTGRLSTCIKRLRAGENVACLQDCVVVNYFVIESDEIHISKDDICNFYKVYPGRMDWPLMTRFNDILRKISEAGLMSLFKRREKRKFVKNFTFQSKYQSLRITFKNIRFAFSFLIIGLLIATCVFIIEMIIHRIMKNLSTC